MVDEERESPDVVRKRIERQMQDFQANREHFEMALRQMAEAYRARFLSLVRAGFTEEQALEIVKARGLG